MITEMTVHKMESVLHCAVISLLLQVSLGEFQAKLSVNQTGSYEIQVGDSSGPLTTWLGSAQTWFRHGNNTFDLDNDNFTLSGFETFVDMKDNFGSHKAYKTMLQADDIFFEVWARDYGDFYIFDQIYLNDTEDTQADDCSASAWPPGNTALKTCFNYTISGYPSFVVGNSQATKLGYLYFADKMFGDYGKQMGTWDSNTPQLLDGMLSGPLAIFDADGNTLLISPVDKFMTTSMWHQGSPGGTVTWGIMGGVNSVPKGYTVRTIVVYASGINKAFERFGYILQSGYPTNPKNEDDTITRLGYWTDNGAYYYYNTENGTTYEQTVIQIEAASIMQKIPYQYIQLDSWFYTKGFMEGVKEWSPRQDIFPNGLGFVSQKLGWQIAAHNRYWSPDNIYAVQNGGKYTFVQETYMALPNDTKFWGDLLSNAGNNWNLQVYEQDWMNIQTIGTVALQTDLDLGEKWLTDMNNAATAAGVSIQYCMALPRHALQSVKYPAVTQARVSDDYHLQGDQWRIGISSIFADAVGLVPFKDTFWTTPDQPGNPRYPNVTEPYPDIETLVATLSTGPVGPGDKIGSSNRDVLLRCCNVDGLILKPSRPARAIDKQIIEKALPGSGGPTGEIWTTYSSVELNGTVDPYYFGIMFATDIQSEFNLYPNMTGFPTPLLNSVVYSYENVYQASVFNDENPLNLTQCTEKDFCLYYFSTTFTMGGSTAFIIGEPNKWVPMSPQRINYVNIGNGLMQIDVSGAKNEEVTLFYTIGNKTDDITCNLGPTGHGLIDTSTMSCGQPVTPRPTSPSNNRAGQLRVGCQFIVALSLTLMLLFH